MAKKKLSLDDLKVESFQTTPDSDEAGQGTVFGFGAPGSAYTEVTLCAPGDTCITCGEPTCDATCSNTCGATCGFTCSGYTCAVTCNTCGSTCFC